MNHFCLFCPNKACIRLLHLFSKNESSLNICVLETIICLSFSLSPDIYKTSIIDLTKRLSVLIKFQSFGVQFQFLASALVSSLLYLLFDCFDWICFINTFYLLNVCLRGNSYFGSIYLGVAGKFFKIEPYFANYLLLDYFIFKRYAKKLGGFF